MRLSEHDKDLIKISDRAHYVFDLEDIICVIRNMELLKGSQNVGQVDLALMDLNNWYLAEHKTKHTGSSERRAINQLYRCRDFLYRNPLFSGKFGGGYYTFKNEKGLYEAHKVIG